MPSLSPLDATRHHSMVRQRADDIHNINFTVDRISRRVSSSLSSHVAASLSEKDRARVDRVMMQGKQTFDKFKKKYQPRTPAQEERVLTFDEAYWVFFALSGSDFDKSVQMADDMTRCLQQLEEIAMFLEKKRRSISWC